MIAVLQATQFGHFRDLRSHRTGSARDVDQIMKQPQKFPARPEAFLGGKKPIKAHAKPQRRKKYKQRNAITLFDSSKLITFYNP
jgi:hypothetical protein